MKNKNNMPCLRNYITFFSLMSALYLAYYLLLHDSCSPFSIGAIIGHAQTLTVDSHLIVLSLLPIYIALMVFGAGIVGAILGKFLYRRIRKTIKNRH